MIRWTHVCLFLVIMFVFVSCSVPFTRTIQMDTEHRHRALETVVDRIKKMENRNRMETFTHVTMMEATVTQTYVGQLRWVVKQQKRLRKNQVTGKMKETNEYVRMPTQHDLLVSTDYQFEVLMCKAIVTRTVGIGVAEDPFIEIGNECVPKNALRARIVLTVSGYLPFNFLNSEITQYLIIDSPESALLSEPEELLLLSMNIWNFNLWGARKNMIRSEIERSRANILVFQEVRVQRSCIRPVYKVRGIVVSFPDSHFPACPSQVQDLVSILPGWSYSWHPAMTFADGDPGTFQSEGLAIFTRKDVITVGELKLSRDPTDDADFHQRLCIFLRIIQKNSVLDFFVTHLSLSERARARSITEIKNFVQRTKNTPSSKYLNEAGGSKLCEIDAAFCYENFQLPHAGSLLAGDFNMDFASNSLISLEDMHPLRDVWSSPNLNGRRFIGWHSLAPHPEEERHGWTFHSWELKSRIDYIFVSQNLLSRIKEIRIVGGDSVSARSVNLPPYTSSAGLDTINGIVYPSDHRFLFVSIN